MKNENYLVNELDKGRNIKIMFVSHNAYWSNLTIINNRYKNCKVDISGECTFFGWNRQLDNYDLIFFYSSSFFDEEDLKKLEQIASKISEEENKRVTVGYSYIIPIDKRKVENMSEEIKIVSFKNSIKNEEDIPIDRYSSTPLILAELLLKTADELDNQKTKKM